MIFDLCLEKDQSDMEELIPKNQGPGFSSSSSPE